jgi:hypothetical protein
MGDTSEGECRRVTCMLLDDLVLHTLPLDNITYVGRSELLVSHDAS